MTLVARGSTRLVHTAPPPQSSGPPQRRAPRCWEARLQPDRQPQIVTDPHQGDRLLIATPMAVAAELAAVPRGALITFAELRERLAQRYGADRSCALATGRFAAIVAGATGDDLRAQRTPRWPVWRLIGNDGRLADHWALAARYCAAQLHAEGHTIALQGRVWKVIAPRRSGDQK
jgi:hypothetical protein